MTIRVATADNFYSLIVEPARSMDFTKRRRTLYANITFNDADDLLKQHAKTLTPDGAAAAVIVETYTDDTTHKGLIREPALGPNKSPITYASWSRSRMTDSDLERTRIVTLADQDTDKGNLIRYLNAPGIDMSTVMVTEQPGGGETLTVDSDPIDANGTRLRLTLTFSRVNRVTTIKYENIASDGAATLIDKLTQSQSNKSRTARRFIFEMRKSADKPTPKRKPTPQPDAQATAMQALDAAIAARDNADALRQAAERRAIDVQHYWEQREAAHEKAHAEHAQHIEQLTQRIAELQLERLDNAERTPETAEEAALDLDVSRGDLRALYHRSRAYVAAGQLIGLAIAPMLVVTGHPDSSDADTVEYLETLGTHVLDYIGDVSNGNTAYTIEKELDAL